jgi:diguanylate cyclase (GGDEF)-like protein/PAS domain S-box-containing protein
MFTQRAGTAARSVVVLDSLAIQVAAPPSERAVGELATVRVPLDGSTTCEDVERWFQADPALRSVVVDRGATAKVVNRAVLHQALVGRLGYGWAVHHRRPVGDLDAPTVWLDADAPIEIVAWSLLEDPRVVAGDDLGVRWSDGRVGTLPASTLFGELSRIHALRVEQVAVSERRFRALVQGSTDVVVLLDATGRVQYVSPAVERVMGVPPAAVVGTVAFASSHPDDVDSVRALFRRALAEPDREVHGEFRMRVADGSWHTFELDGRNRLADPAVRGVVVNYRDVTDRRRLEGELRHQALHDPLTGLANRTVFTVRVRHALERRRRTGEPITVLYCDLDRFKAVNDTYGHQAGDELLRAVSARLTSVLDAGDTLARFGGDEFAVLLEAVDTAGAVEVADRMRAALRLPFPLGVSRIVVALSVGVGPASDADCDEDELIRRADTALYQAKAAGRDHTAVWDSRTDREALVQRHLEVELRDALALDQLSLAYQPIYDVRTERIAGVEALLRWDHPERGRISPGTFVPIAEAGNQIVAIGRWVLDQACRQLASWDAVLGTTVPYMSVNLSARQLTHEALVGDVAGVLELHGLPARRLQLEVTETALMADLDHAQRTLRTLHDLGCRIAIDDFGTGYSSLSYLHRFPVDTVKLDRSFIELLGVETDTIVRGIIALAHALELDVTAEGVETVDQLAVLTALHADHVQGYLLARPAPPDQLRLDPGPLRARVIES